MFSWLQRGSPLVCSPGTAYKEQSFRHSLMPWLEHWWLPASSYLFFLIPLPSYYIFILTINTIYGCTLILAFLGISCHSPELFHQSLNWPPAYTTISLCACFVCRSMPGNASAGQFLITKAQGEESIVTALLALDHPQTRESSEPWTLSEAFKTSLLGLIASK